MTDSDREDFEAQLAARAVLRRRETPRAQRRVMLGLEAADTGTVDNAASRIDAIEQATPHEAQPGMTIPQVIERLADDNEDANVRQAALAKIKQFEFLGPVLDPYRPDILEAMKRAAKSRVVDLVRLALEYLAARKEAFARDMLLAFLKDPKSAVLPLAKTVQLLSYDDHSDVVQNVRGLLEHLKDEPIKDENVLEEAVRLLSSDSGSEGLLAKLLRDKTQPTNIRSLSASGLNNLNPKLFADIATKIVDDDNEDDDLRATTLSALTHFSDYAKERLDQGLRSKVEQLVDGAPSVNLKATASRFLNRIKQER